MTASDAPSQRLQTELDRLDGADIEDSEKDAIRETIENLRVRANGGSEKHASDSTRQTYCRMLRVVATSTDVVLTECTDEELNEQLNEMADSREWADTTLAGYQSAATAFVRHQGGDPEVIDIQPVPSRSRSIDPRTVLTPEEFHDLRESAISVRDRCLIDLLGYTGQRVRVIQALTLRDIDEQEGIYYLPDVDGLKGAEGKRPLLGARKSVTEWKQMHPTGDPDDALITAVVDGTGVPGDELTQHQLNKRLQKTADRAGIDKPVNAHAFRHFFATVCKTRYGMDDGTIKHLLGHAPGSSVMETTYQHLNDEEHISAAREAFGIEDDTTDRTGLAPPVCPTCGIPLRAEAEVCPTPTCTERFAPTREPDAVEDVEAELSTLAAELEDKIERFEKLKEAAGD